MSKTPSVLPDPNPLRLNLTPRAAAVLSGMSPTILRELARRGEIIGSQPLAEWRYNEESIVAYLERAAAAHRDAS